MRRAFFSILISSMVAIGPASAAPVLMQDEPSPAYRFPALPGVPSPLPRSPYGSAADAGPSGNPGVTAPLVPSVKPPAPPKVETTQRERLDDLFQRLAHAADADEAEGLAQAIQHVWLQSGSDTADLLMVRAVAALGKGKLDVSSELLDKIVVIDPGWSEAWNRRATLRFLKNDDVGAMEDIAQVLALEPRHFGALSGMSFILHRNGMDKQALALIRRTEAIWPHNAELEKLATELSLEVEGREI